MKSSIPWNPEIVLKRHPAPGWPRSKNWAAQARGLYLSIICARSPRDRTLAAIFDIPFEQIEADRRLFGELQSLQRQLAITLRGVQCSDTKYQRHQIVQAGIELLFLIIFGIEPPQKLILMKLGFQDRVLEVIEKWEAGGYGDPNSPQAASSVVIDLGKVSLAHRLPWRWVDRTYWNTDSEIEIQIIKRNNEMALADYQKI